MYKLKYKLLPNKFQSLFKLNNTVHSISTQNTEAYHCRYYSKTTTQQFIGYSGVKVWNALPNKIKEIQSKSVFASKLKEHLLNKSDREKS